jgi:hypothetical protein
MSNMTGQKQTKLNQLVSELGDGWLVPSAWLAARGYTRSLLGYYVQRGWLQSPARGVFLRAGSKPSWQTVVYSLQRLAGLPLHVGGRHALSLQGQDHYLRMGPAVVTLYGQAKLPGWVHQLDLPERFSLFSDARIALTPLAEPLLDDRAQLFDAGLTLLPGDRPGCPLVVSLPERAILEVLLGVPHAASVVEADAILQGMANLRPALVSALLGRCASVKVKRLFLALAERHAQAWFARLDLERVDLGTGKRVLRSGERLHPKYQISLPRDLDEQLG